MTYISFYYHSYQNTVWLILLIIVCFEQSLCKVTVSQKFKATNNGKICNIGFYVVIVLLSLYLLCNYTEARVYY